MSQLNEKTTCIFYKSLFEAAERFYEKDPATALEIYHSFFRYAFCETEGIETDNEIAELLVKQNVESFNAADNRFATAVRNGDKGKEYGILGKEYGKLGGRPRKGESREEYWERKRRECETGVKDDYVPPKDEKRERAKVLSKNYKKADASHNRGESTLTPGWIKTNILSGQKCVYCGESDWHLLGCDRIDNSLPHTPDNVVCSCSKCNIERGSMTYEEFREKKGITPLNPPLSPDKETPLTIAIATSISSSKANTISNSITNSLDIEKKTYKDHIIYFVKNNKTLDYILLSCTPGRFFSKYKDKVLELMTEIENNTDDTPSSDSVLKDIYDCAQEMGVL